MRPTCEFNEHPRAYVLVQAYIYCALSIAEPLRAIFDVYLCLRLVGKAAFLLKEHGQSELAYRKATELNSALPPAWKGLVELHLATQEDARLIDALVHLVSTAAVAALLASEQRLPHSCEPCGQLALAEPSEGPAKQQEYRRRLAELYQKHGQHSKAAALLQELLDQLDESEPSYLSTLCQLADAQVQLCKAFH